MTGAEVIIRQGNTCILGKVRHDGYDVGDFFKKTCFKHAFDKLWPAYIAWRERHYGKDSLDSIETKFINGYRFIFKSRKPTAEWLDKAITKAEEAINEIDEEDGYTCSYGDHRLIIDYDTKTIINTNEEEQE